MMKDVQSQEMQEYHIITGIMLMQLLRRVKHPMVLPVHHGHQQRLQSIVRLVVIQTVSSIVRRAIHGMVGIVYEVVVRPVEMQSKNEQKLVMMEM
jgi:hypothetical protein